MIATTPAPNAGPRQARLGRPAALRLAAEEYDRFLALLGGLAPADRDRPTDCPAAMVIASAPDPVDSTVKPARSG